SGRNARGTGFALTLAVLALGWLGGWSSGARAQDDATTLERRVKAAYIFKFAGYVEWPDGVFAQPDTPLNIAVLGDDEIAAELAQITAGRMVDGRPVRVKRTRDSDATADAHMLFVGRAEIARLPQLAKQARAKPVLILTDAPGALNQGSMINFMLIQQRVKFEISLDEAERRGLRLSSRLLAVAHNVRKTVP
ncbi:MAG: YfiR family protein, partial [Betaproteobacteria bacterium]